MPSIPQSGQGTQFNTFKKQKLGDERWDEEVLEVDRGRSSILSKSRSQGTNDGARKSWGGKKNCGMRIADCGLTRSEGARNRNNKCVDKLRNCAVWTATSFLTSRWICSSA